MGKKRPTRPARMPSRPSSATAAHPELHELLATAADLHRQGHLPQAEMLYQTILRVDPQHAGALHLLGVAAQQRGRSADAVGLIAAAIEVAPGVAQYHFNHGVALQALARHEEAAEAYGHAVRLKADYGAAYENLGVALQDAGDLDGARRAYEQALEHDGGAVLAHQNLGTLLIGLGDIETARRHLQAALERDPANPEAHSKLASTLLAAGRYREGWEEYEWRAHAGSFVEHNPVRVVPFPKWDGSPLEGKTILIHAEQGIGDEIMFASCYADVLARAQRTLIECDPRLVALFARSFPDAIVVPGAKNADFCWSEELGEIDCRIPAGSLPSLLRNTADDFPRSGAPYLRADPEALAKWRRTIGVADRPLNVGISWSGGKDPRSRKARSIPLEEWAPVLATSDVNFIDLQYGDHAAEIDAFHAQEAGRLHSPDGLDALADPDGLIGLIAALDLVVSIDNSTVFMAAAVGTPVWVLLPSNAEWRWFGAGSRSIWYPAAQLFRQSEPGLPAWRTVLRRVARELAELATATTPPVPALQPPGARPPPAHAAPTAAPSDAAPHRALLVNDTSSWYHWGCSCTSLAIHAALRRSWQSVESLPIHRLHNLAELPQAVEAFDDDERFARFAAAHPDIIARLQAADVVYVNGEGTLHNVSAGAVGLLYLAYVARRRLEKPVRLINHSCYPDDTAAPSDSVASQLYRKVYRELDYVAVREATSAKLVAAMGVEPVLAFDCLPLFVRRYAGALRSRAAASKRVVIAGSVAWGASDRVAAIGELVRRLHAAGFEPVVLIGANAYPAADDRHFVTALQRSAEGAFVLRNATSELEWLGTIADAALLISGRFHHSIAAAFLDTPFIVMESNTPKIAGLLGMLEVDSFVSIDRLDLAAALYDRARDHLAGRTHSAVSAATKTRLLDMADQNFASVR